MPTLNEIDRKTMTPFDYELKYGKFSYEEQYDPASDPGHVFHVMAAGAAVDPLTYVGLGQESGLFRAAGGATKGAVRRMGMLVRETPALHPGNYRFHPGTVSSGGFGSFPEYIGPRKMAGAAEDVAAAEARAAAQQAEKALGAASKRTPFDEVFYDNQYRRFSKKSELVPADDFVNSEGVVLKAHPNKHSLSKANQIDVLNNWERSWTGVNYNGRPVDVYWKDNMAVITQRGAKDKIITAYDNVPHTRWSDRSNWQTEVTEEVYKAFMRNTQR